jgi:filamentous hemagglutinin
MDIHEVQPVKFGGDPVDSANKTLIERPRHWEVTAWWKKLQNDVEGK